MALRVYQLFNILPVCIKTHTHTHTHKDWIFARMSPKGKKFYFSLCRIQKKKIENLETIVFNRGVKIKSRYFF